MSPLEVDDLGSEARITYSEFQKDSLNLSRYYNY